METPHADQPTDATASFDEWAIVELFGHQKMAGHVTPSPIGDMLRVDVHDTEAEDGTPRILYTRIINPKAIYAINPCSREIAIAVGRKLAQPPISRWELSRMLPATSVVSVQADREPDYDAYERELDEDDEIGDDNPF